MPISLKDKFDCVREQWIAANVKAALSLREDDNVKAWLNREGEIKLIRPPQSIYLQSIYLRQKDQGLVCDVTRDLIHYTAEALADARNRALLKLQSEVLKHINIRKNATSSRRKALLTKLQMIGQRIHRLAEEQCSNLLPQGLDYEQIMMRRDYAELLGGSQLVDDHQRALSCGLVISEESAEFEIRDYIACVRKDALLSNTQEAIANGFVVACGDFHLFRSSIDHSFIQTRRARYKYRYHVNCFARESGENANEIKMELPVELIHALDDDLRSSKELAIAPRGVTKHVPYIFTTPEQFNSRSKVFHIQVTRTLVKDPDPALGPSNPLAEYS